MGKVYIRSQDRERLVLFGEGINAIYYLFTPEIHLSKNETTPEQHAIVATGNNTRYRLGIYESKERCLAILDEIQLRSESYHRIKSLAQDLLFEMPTCYEMPEK